MCVPEDSSGLVIAVQGKKPVAGSVVQQEAACAPEPFELAILAAVLAIGSQVPPKQFLPKAVELYKAAVSAKVEAETPAKCEYLLLYAGNDVCSPAQEYLKKIGSEFDWSTSQSVLKGLKKYEIYSSNQFNADNWKEKGQEPACWRDGEKRWEAYLEKHKTANGWKIERSHLDRFIAFRRDFKKRGGRWKEIRPLARGEIAAEVGKKINPK
jgi:hypothetical protein